MMGGQAGEWRFVIPLLPPSANALCEIRWSQRKVVPKPSVLKWRSDASYYIPRIQLQQSESVIEIDCVFHYRFHYQNGKLRVFDTHNLVKALLDTIAWKAGFDDKRVKQGSWKSIDSKDEKVEVVMRELCAPTASAATGEL